MSKDIGKLVGGVWLPATEVHFQDIMTGKDARKVDGKLTYQYKKLEAAMKFLPENRRGIAVDIGGHVGLWAMHMVGMFAHVHAFEPVPIHAELFKRNVTADNCTLHECALGEEAGTVTFEIPLETTGNAHLAIGRRHQGTRHVPNPDAQYQVEGIEMCTLDSFNFTGVDFVKIDVEGLERAVINGGIEFFTTNKPVIVVEQKGNDSDYGDLPNAAVKLLESWGAKVLQVMSGDYIMGW